MPIKILDVGGIEEYWINNGIIDDNRFQITLLNLKLSEVHYSNFKSVIGNATDLRQYRDKEFDIVFSNSVIDHLSTLDDQRKMADEVSRVGKYFFVQSPYRYFPVEPHFLLPFAQFMPRRFLQYILTKTKLSRSKIWGKEYAEGYIKEIRLLSINDMRRMFPQSRIYKERFLGIVKSISAYNFSK